jgi:hypothetical protein
MPQDYLKMARKSVRALPERTDDVAIGPSPADTGRAISVESAISPRCIRCGRTASTLPSRAGQCEGCWYADLIASIPAGAPSGTLVYEMGADERRLLIPANRSDE